VSRASISEADAGEFRLSGVLDFRTGPALREQGGQLLGATRAEACVLDCSAVEKSSSVGLALLLALMRDAQAAGKSLALRGLPQDMREIASVCGLLELLPLQE
jgi:phospholipid transport system transporter-binding protein